MAEEPTGNSEPNETLDEKQTRQLTHFISDLRTRYHSGWSGEGTDWAPLYLNGLGPAHPVIVGYPGVTSSSLLVSGDMIVGTGGPRILKTRHVEGKHHANDSDDALYLNWVSAQPVIVGNPGGNKTSLLVSGDMTVGAGQSGVLKVRHVEGKHHANDNPDPLYLNWISAQPVIIGSDTAQANLHVSGDIFLSSDARLKTDVHDISGALEKLQKVRGVRFARRDADNARNGGAGPQDMGVIAQDVEAVFPELVHSPDDQSYKAVNYNGLIGVLIEATKELKAENEALRRRIDALESELGE